MNTKVIIGIVVVLVCIVIGGAVWFSLNNNNLNSENQNVNSNDDSISQINDNQVNQKEENLNTDSNSGKTLVVYFSAQNHTKSVAEKIAENLNADIFRIEPVDEYTSEDLNWSDNDSRVTKEHEDESLRNVELVSTTPEDWDSYDRILIGYPIWWGIAAWPVDSFVEANNFNGKTVIPFCTSSSSVLGESGELLVGKANGGDWQEGHRFSSNPSDSDIKAWTDELQ